MVITTWVVQPTIVVAMVADVKWRYWRLHLIGCVVAAMSYGARSSKGNLAVILGAGALVIIGIAFAVDARSNIRKGRRQSRKR